MLWTSVVTLTWSRNHDFFPSWFWLNSASGYIHLMGSRPQFFRNFVGHFSSRFFDCAINLPLKANSQFQWHFAVLQNEALLFRLVLEFQKTASGNIYARWKNLPLLISSSINFPRNWGFVRSIPVFNEETSRPNSNFSKLFGAFASVSSFFAVDE